MWLHFLVSFLLFSLVDIKLHKIRQNHLIIAILTLLPLVNCASLIFGVLNYLVYRVLYVLSQKRIGYGDVRLSFLMGLYSGTLFESFLALAWINVSAWGSAGAFSLIRLIKLGIALNDRVPFAPFMFLGVIVTALMLN